ncbi:MAG: hypothetical protein KIT31_40380, partial [Deltaproteobacteria bacterium]|nr:hypothetical protein [Deltaproteobacteria bacterium]
MGLRGPAALVGTVLLTTSAAEAVVPRTGAARSSKRPAAETLTALPAAGVGKPLRTQPRLAFGART